MRVRVELHGVLQKYARDGRVQVEVEEGTTVGDLVAHLGISEDASWNAALDGKLVYAADRLSEGAVLVIFPPLAGG